MTGFDRERTDSFGKTLVGLAFNPSGDTGVTKIKMLFAEIIDVLHDGFEKSPDEGPEQFIWRQAIMDALAAQMMAVKAQTWKR